MNRVRINQMAEVRHISVTVMLARGFLQCGLDASGPPDRGPHASSRRCGPPRSYPAPTRSKSCRPTTADCPRETALIRSETWHTP
jgi:hypothetical protein